ncbi:MAG: protein translocase subunit SecD [Candidatus Comchoanobacterales bacterium]
MLSQYKRLVRYTLVVILLIFSILYAIPNFYPNQPSIIIQMADQSTLNPDTIKAYGDELTKQKLLINQPEIVDNKAVLRFSDLDNQSKAYDLLLNDIISKSDLVRLRLSLQITKSVPSFFNFFSAQPMRLGLDLQGGVNLTLKVDLDHDVGNLINKSMNSIKSNFNTPGKDRVSFFTLSKNDETSFTIKFASETKGVDENMYQKAKKLLAENDMYQGIKQSFSYVTNDDDKAIILTMKENVATKDDKAKMDDTVRILNNRTNELGVSEAVIYTVGHNEISVNIPGIQDPAMAREIIGNTASLSFHLVSNVVANNFGNTTSLLDEKSGRMISFYERPIITGDAIVDSSNTLTTTRMDALPKWVVNVTLDGNQSLFYRTTDNYAGKGSFVVVYHEYKKNEMGERIDHAKIISVAGFNHKLGDNWYIEGSFTEQSSKELSMLIRSGSFKAPVDIVQEKVIGPSLGGDNISKGSVSLIIGLGLIFVFMAIYYRGFGLIANLGLLVNLLLTMSLLSVLGATLTLPGIAGIVLGVGMAVDANVLINERIREELRKGTSVYSAIQAGYDKAFVTIVDANVTTLIVALVLFGLGTAGLIKGFAVTLTIGLIASMLTAVFFTRSIALLFYKQSSKHISIGI